MNLPRQPEDQLLARILKQAGSGPHRARNGYLKLGIGDDAALFKPSPGLESILTCDWFLEGTHFLVEKHPADSVGWKCLARATSDVAAMGGVPRCFLLSLALPASRTGAWLDEFLKGLHRAARSLGCELAGGDTTRNKQVLINVTVIGEVAAGLGVTRAGARPGDSLYVSGRLGEAEQGLRLLRQSKDGFNSNNVRLEKHLYPEPRLALGQWLATHRLATAMMDLSDGLSSDLPRLCAASKAGTVVNSEFIPAPPNLPTWKALALALHGGDDYELLFTVSRKNRSRIPKKHEGVRLTEIGVITRDKKILLQTGKKLRPLQPAGWDPFRKR
jgi:thiamine-monophosphate kinase